MLTTKNFVSVSTQDDDVDRMQVNISNAVDPVLNTEILDGVLLTGLTIPASLKLVAAHGLGRPADGYAVVASSAAVSLPYAVAAEQTTPNGAVVLSFSSGAGAVISLWVF